MFPSVISYILNDIRPPILKLFPATLMQILMFVFIYVFYILLITGLPVMVYYLLKIEKAHCE